jgi:hypothetical protein
MEENVESAIQKGMYALGFSDHSYTPCDNPSHKTKGVYPFLDFTYLRVADGSRC